MVSPVSNPAAIDSALPAEEASKKYNGTGTLEGETGVENMRRVRASFVLAAGLAVASCGGGGGGSPPAAPPPPPPTVVVANASASAASVQEGQPFSIDASASTVTNGSAPTFAWTQVSGPQVTIASANTAKLDLTAVEVTADTVAQFRVTVTSGTVTSQATVDVTFANIAQTPVFATLTPAANTTFNASFSGAVETILGNWSFGLVGTTTAAGGPITLSGFQQTGIQVIATVAPFAGSFTQPVKFDMDPSQPIGTSFDFDAPFMMIMEESANRFRVVRKSPGGAYALPFMDRTISRPCGTFYPFVDPPAAGGNTVIIGQREQGFSILSLDAAGTLYQQVSTGKSLCTLVTAETPVNSTSSSYIGVPQPAMPDVIAIDTTANTVYRFGASTGDPNLYELKAEAPVQLQSTAPLNFVAATPIRFVDTAGSYFGHAGLALVYTDGQHAGQHRLVLVGLTATGHNIFQSTRSWTTGVPSDVIQDNLDGDSRPEIVVISSSSPQAIVFETTSSMPVSLPLTPSFVEIGLGATEALPLVNNVLSTGTLYVAYRARNLVRLFLR
jgi:hypothetical protein